MGHIDFLAFVRIPTSTKFFASHFENQVRRPCKSPETNILPMITTSGPSSWLYFVLHQRNNCVKKEAQSTWIGACV